MSSERKADLCILIDRQFLSFRCSGLYRDSGFSCVLRYFEGHGDLVL